MFELVAAGIEGGSKRAILDEWDLHDVGAIRRHWAEYGPPVHIALAALATGWGVTLTTAAAASAPFAGDPLQGLGDLPSVRVPSPLRGLPTA